MQGQIFKRSWLQLLELLNPYIKTQISKLFYNKISFLYHHWLCLEKPFIRNYNFKRKYEHFQYKSSLAFLSIFRSSTISTDLVASSLWQCWTISCLFWDVFRPTCPSDTNLSAVCEVFQPTIRQKMSSILKSNYWVY